MRTPLVAGNWKMNGSKASVSELTKGICTRVPGQGADVLVCPPYPYLAQVGELLAGTSIKLGAQNLSQFSNGAYTGEVSAAMLTDFGCRYVIVGHSERRALFGDSDAVVAAKFSAAQAASLIPILCVGETLAERESGETLAVVERQLMAVVQVSGAEALSHCVLAYEPVWAIGTGLTATPEQAQEVHSALRAKVAALKVDVAEGLRILYGGSVKAANAGELFQCEDIDGGLIGGASLNPAEFAEICQAAG